MRMSHSISVAICPNVDGLRPFPALTALENTKIVNNFFYVANCTKIAPPLYSNMHEILFGPITNEPMHWLLRNLA